MKMEKNNNEELQSRRQFFKKAAKAALPILGAAVLSQTPLIASASNVASGCSRYGCGTCTGSCRSSCSGGCNTTCSGGCKHYACKGVNKR